MLGVELADELAELVAQLKNQLGRHYAAGTWAAPGSATARTVSSVDPVAIDEAAEPVPVETVDDGASPIVQLGRRSLAQIRAELGDCTRCKLHSTRKSI